MIYKHLLGKTHLYMAIFQINYKLLNNHNIFTASNIKLLFKVRAIFLFSIVSLFCSVSKIRYSSFQLECGAANQTTFALIQKKQQKLPTKICQMHFQSGYSKSHGGPGFAIRTGARVGMSRVLQYTKGPPCPLLSCRTYFVSFLQGQSPSLSYVQVTISYPFLQHLTSLDYSE